MAEPAAAPSSISASKASWVDFLLTRGPVGVIALGGTGALFNGLFPSFQIREAVFGASLLLVAAGFDLFVWLARRNQAIRDLADANRARDLAAQAVADADASAPTTLPPSKPKPPELPA